MATRPIIIVGGGPVGMTEALLLANLEVPAVILEATEQRDPIGSKALCMQRDVLDVLERVGCGDRLLAEGVTWTMGRTYYRHHELFQITFPEIGDNHYPPFVNVGQDRTEYWLEDAVDRSDLIELRYGHAAAELDQNGDAVQVVAETDRGTVPVEGEYVIGADGSRSTMRKLMGAGFPGKSFDDKFLICDIRAELGFADERRFFFDPEWNPDRQVLIHPQADSVWRIDWQVPPDFDLEEEKRSGGLDQRIRKIVGTSDYEIVWLSVYRFHQRIADTFRVGRAFLAGDAAHIVSPFGARGLNSGIQDAENLAWKLAFVRHGWAAPGLLDSYNIERRAAAEENLAITGATMDFLVPPTPELWERRRQTLEAAVGNPQAREMVDSGQLAQPFDYADSPLTTPPNLETSISPGMLVPDAPVVAAAGGKTRLRLLMGRSFLVITTGDPSRLDEVGGLSPMPIDVFSLEMLDVAGVLSATLRLPAETAAIIRPDGHLAAVVPAAPSPVASALERAVGGAP